MNYIVAICGFNFLNWTSFYQEDGDPQCGRPIFLELIQLCSTNQHLDDDKSWKHRSGFFTSTTAKAMTLAPGPYSPGKMGTQVPILPVKWGPRVPILGGPHFPMTPAWISSGYTVSVGWIGWTGKRPQPLTLIV